MRKWAILALRAAIDNAWWAGLTVAGTPARSWPR